MDLADSVSLCPWCEGGSSCLLGGRGDFPGFQEAAYALLSRWLTVLWLLASLWAHCVEELQTPGGPALDLGWSSLPWVSSVPKASVHLPPVICSQFPTSLSLNFCLECKHLYCQYTDLSLCIWGLWKRYFMCLLDVFFSSWKEQNCLI